MACPYQRSQAASCPVLHSGLGGKSNREWFPGSHLPLEALKNNSIPPVDERFASLDLMAVKRDLEALLTNSQDWWPADYGNYGPFFIRMAWHSAGTYRIHDGRGGGRSGQQRFSPLDSWPDNGNLDKARRLLWPIYQRYPISWADLLILAGNVALERMGMPTFGFGGGRVDAMEPELVNWGYETQWMGDERYQGNRQLNQPLGAVQMGLIYVNPEGPNGNPDPLASARDIRETFGRMAMNDEETVALVAGGHTFGKCHGAADPANVGPAPAGNDNLEDQGFGWKNQHGSGKANDTITSGIEGAWTRNPTKWDNGYFENLFGYEWELSKSPAGAHQWTPKGRAANGTVPEAFGPGKTHPIMTTADMALRMDPVYQKISIRFYQNPLEFQQAFAKAWYKLTHRDMGPYSRLLGPEVPPPQPWQDPVPHVEHPLIDAKDAELIKQEILKTGIPVSRLVATAWASASSFRCSDMRGGSNGARIRLEPMRSWQFNEPARLTVALEALEKVQQSFNSRSIGRQVSLADVIVLAGCAGVEEAVRRIGWNVKVPFCPGRADATQEMTDVESFQAMEPIADGFRNYLRPVPIQSKPEELLVDKANLLSLSIAEMTCLVGGLRVLGVGCDQTSAFTTRVGTLSNDFFVNLLDMRTEWNRVGENLYEGRDRQTGSPRYTATRVDLVFGSNSILRAQAEVYGGYGGQAKLVNDFCNAFGKVLNLDLDCERPRAQVTSRL